ncbi:MAG: hypothetical protein ACFFC7_29610 [Candidatus Hermodarchaeota archaeon]
MINEKLTNVISKMTESSYQYTVAEAAKICENIKNTLTHFLQLRIKALLWGNSLYNMGILFQLPQDMQILANTLMQEAKSLEELKRIHPELQEKIELILNDMIDLGYVSKTSQGRFQLQ